MNLRGIIFGILIFGAVAGAEKFSIIALSDPHMRSPRWIKALSEIRDRSATAMVAPAVAFVVAGDIYASKMYPDYLTVFKDTPHKPDFLPCVGDHDADSPSEYARLREVVEAIPQKNKKNDDVNYFVDYRTVRIIVVNMFKVGANTFGVNHNINAAGREWVESVITSATKAEHVFIVFYGPAFPRIRHTTDSFNASRDERDAFWDMLMKHNDKVKAVIVGSVHYYFRMRVADPRNKDPNDVNNPANLPDQPGGIYQICPGSTGKVEVDCFVNIEIDDRVIDFRTFRASGQAESLFQEIDRWSIGTHGSVGVAPKGVQSDLTPSRVPYFQSIIAHEGTVAFTYRSGAHGPASFSIYSLSGALVHSFYHTPASGYSTATAQWNLQESTGSAVSPALYLVRMQSGLHAISRTFWVSR